MNEKKLVPEIEFIKFQTDVISTSVEPMKNNGADNDDGYHIGFNFEDLLR